ncbi:MAG: class I SAM-dependent methyltransferase [Thermoplasmatota archaeon]
MAFINSYEDEKRAEAYAKLKFADTYYLAYRDLPRIISLHVKGKHAIDFGCGTGRSTRFLQELGFHTIGLDISKEMISIARSLDPTGDYRYIIDGDFSSLTKESYDLVLSAFTFDNIPKMESKVSLFTGLGTLLNGEGKIINLVSSPKIYIHEWASFTTKDFPENRYARGGDIVKIITKDIQDERPCDDILWTDKDYRKVFRGSELTIVDIHRPLAQGDEPYGWVNETKIPPWVIYVLGRASNVS